MIDVSFVRVHNIDVIRIESIAMKLLYQHTFINFLFLIEVKIISLPIEYILNLSFFSKLFFSNFSPSYHKNDCTKWLQICRVYAVLANALNEQWCITKSVRKILKIQNTICFGYQNNTSQWKTLYFQLVWLYRFVIDWN